MLTQALALIEGEQRDGFSLVIEKRPTDDRSLLVAGQFRNAYGFGG